MRTLLPLFTSRKFNQHRALRQLPQRSCRLVVFILAVALPRAVCWSGRPSDRASNAKILSQHRLSQQQLESNVLCQARTAVVSCWAAGVFLAATALPCPPALAASPTTQIKIKVETELLERTLESQRGDINGAVSQLAQTVPTTSIRFAPPLNPELVQKWLETQEPSVEPLVDVDQMVLDTWQDITSVFSSRQQRAPNFLSQKFTFNLPAPGGTTQSITISIGPFLLSAAFLSYPLAYAFYQFEQDQEMRAAEAKKMSLKAKQAPKPKPPKRKDVEKATTTTAEKGLNGSASTTSASPSTPSKMDEIKAEAPLVPLSEKPKLSSPPIQNVPVPEPPLKATLSSSSSQEGGMDAYEQAYAAMLSTSRVSLTSDFSKTKKGKAPAQNEIITSIETQTVTVPLPPPHTPEKLTPTSLEQQEGGGMDAYAQAYATMLSAQAKSTATRTTAVNPEPSVEPKPADPTATPSTPSPDLQRQGDEDYNYSMSAYEKAYAAMTQNTNKSQSS